VEAILPKERQQGLPRHQQKRELSFHSHIPLRLQLWLKLARMKCELEDFLP